MLSLPINIFQDIFEVATFFATRLGVSGTEINNCNTVIRKAYFILVLFIRGVYRHMV